MKFHVTGLNIQWPWSQLLLDGKKKIETRSYPLPERLRGEWVAVIETPGPKGKSVGIDKARVTGLIRFSGSKLYSTREEWQEDHALHLVYPNDPIFGFQPEKPKYGWIVEDVRHLPPQAAPTARGIVYSKPFTIHLN